MRFFFYGTLVAGSANPVAQAIHAKLTAEGPAAVAGRLFALSDLSGWFPALVAGAGTVHGQVYRAGPEFTAADLAAMDRYEDFDPAAPLTSRYLRAEGSLIDGSLIALYRYNLPLPESAVPIPGGDFRQWLNSAGLPEFTGQHRG